MYAQTALLSTLATSIIAEHHPHLEPLRVAYMFRGEAEIKNGKAVPGRTHRATDRDYALHGFDFVIAIAKDAWDELRDEHKYALLDHFISYMGLRYEQVAGNWVPMRDPETGRYRSYKKEPDVREFEVVIARHGAYTAEIRRLLRAFAERRVEEKKVEANKKKGRKKVEADAKTVDLVSDVEDLSRAEESGVGEHA